MEVVFAKGWNYAERKHDFKNMPRHQVLVREALEAGKTVEEYMKDSVPERERDFQKKRHEQFMTHFMNAPIVESCHPVEDPDKERPDEELFAEALEAAKRRMPL